MSESGPSVHTIPSGASFLDALARGIVDRFGDPDDPLILANVIVLLPTRRAVRALSDAFRAHMGGTVILPSVRPIGDVDEDIFALADEPVVNVTTTSSIPPAMASVRRTLLIMDRFRRRFLLSRLVQAWLDASGGGDSVLLAAELSQSLSELLDTLQTENISLDRLPELVPDHFATHWRQSIDFLDILRSTWPTILSEEGAMDPGARRNALLMALCEDWKKSPPASPVIAAGSTGSIPATAELLKTIARLPQGHVVLPGVDLEMDASVWEQLEQGHPQDGMRRLLLHMGADREDVTAWDNRTIARDLVLRTRLINQSLVPWQATGQWRDLSRTIGATKQDVSASLEHIHRIDAAHPGEEAGVIALIIRETLETPGKTAALVTPDRLLARRVASELKRWHIDVNDSAGRPLATSALFSYLRLVAKAVESDFDGIALLSLLKHPLASCGVPPAECRRLARLLERRVLRGPSPAPGLQGIREGIDRLVPENEKPLLETLVDTLTCAFEPLSALFREEEASFVDLVQAHIAASEQIATSDTTTGSQRLWAGDQGEAAALFINELVEHGPTLETIDPLQYPDLLEVLSRGRVIRDAHPLHPSVSIWGPLEARLQRADVTVLGGLNEGTWPMEVTVDPWLSRPMRADLGMSAPEQRIGLSAHDFVQGASAPLTYLTRSEKVDGTPTVPSRWLLRLDTILEGLGAQNALHTANRYLSLQRALQVTSHPEKPFVFKPTERPRPCPALAARPRRLSVTQVEILIRDPYAIYARHVLKLKPLDPIAADPGALERGILIHEILNEFVKTYPDTLPPDAESRLTKLGRRHFDQAVEGPSVEAFWWPRFESFVAWFIPFERQWRERGNLPRVTEVMGRTEFSSVGGKFLLTAQADRFDSTATGGLVVIDYKTGAKPSNKQVMSGLAPQLSLEAAIAADGGFEGLAPAPIDQLTYIRIAGGAMGGEASSVSVDVPELVSHTMLGFQRLIALYDDCQMPYMPRVRPIRDDIDGPYDHLARVKEWQASDMGEDG